MLVFLLLRRARQQHVQGGTGSCFVIYYREIKERLDLPGRCHEASYSRRR